MTKIFALASLLIFIGNLNALELHFKDPQYSFQLLRTIGYTATGSADIGECLKTAYKIKNGDDESWYREWHKTAKQLEKDAIDFLEAGHKISARQAFFRASNYYRTAEFFLHTDPNDPRIKKTWTKSIFCFQQAAKLSPYIIEPVKIPFEGTTLPGYLCKVDNSGKKRPTLIIQTGFDGSKEELYFALGRAALERGYNCLLFEGPGQGEVIRFQGLTFRYNWETVVSPVIDFMEKQPEADLKKLTLIGYSFGGYLAPRAAAFEKRIKLLVANGGVYDFYTPFASHFPPNLPHILASKKESALLNSDVYERMKTNTDLRWVFSNGMWTFGKSTPSTFLKALIPYNLKKVAILIKCPTLIVNSTGDRDMPGQSLKLYKALRCPKSYMVFSPKEGAEEHCQVGAVMISSERILNWLDNYLRRK